MTFQHLKVAYRKAGEGLFIGVCSNRMRGNGFKLEEGRFRLHICLSNTVFEMKEVN